VADERRLSQELPHGQQLNTAAAPTVPRLAASVIIVRGGAGALELLLVQRTPHARFMGGAWVFPGGAVDRAEGVDEGAIRAAAVRELREEAAIVLDGPHALIPYSRWITPALVTVRFDTYFFVATLPDDQVPVVDGQECVDLGWYTPAAALEAGRAGELLLFFPTIKHLEELGRFATADALLEHARGHEVVPVEPRVLQGEGQLARIVLPGEPGYDGAPAGPGSV
jgi:8-oxo-dGTP pyrophosphatase MutT (NUDIX family)